MSIALTPDGKKIVSGGSDKTIRIRDTETGEQLKMLAGHDRTVTDIAVSPLVVRTRVESVNRYSFESVPEMDGRSL